MNNENMTYFHDFNLKQKKLIPLEYGLHCINGKWKPYLLRGAYHAGTMRFNQGKNFLNVRQKVLSTQLKELESDRLMERFVVYKNSIPVRIEYRLTDKGESLVQLLGSLYDWGRAQLQSRNIPIDPYAEMVHGYGEVVQMQRAPVFEMINPYEYIFKNIFGKWKVYIFLALYLQGTTRFNKLSKDLGVSEKVLSEQLKVLEQTGLVSRMDLPKIPPHVEYSLTSDGESLIKLLSSLNEWGKEQMQKEGISADSFTR